MTSPSSKTQQQPQAQQQQPKQQRKQRGRGPSSADKCQWTFQHVQFLNGKIKKPKGKFTRHAKSTFFSYVPPSSTNVVIPSSTHSHTQQQPSSGAVRTAGQIPPALTTAIVHCKSPPTTKQQQNELYQRMYCALFGVTNHQHHHHEVKFPIRAAQRRSITISELLN